MTKSIYRSQPYVATFWDQPAKSISPGKIQDKSWIRLQVFKSGLKEAVQERSYRCKTDPSPEELIKIKFMVVKHCHSGVSLRRLVDSVFNPVHDRVHRMTLGHLSNIFIHGKMISAFFDAVMKYDYKNDDVTVSRDVMPKNFWILKRSITENLILARAANIKHPVLEAIRIVYPKMGIPFGLRKDGTLLIFRP